MTFIPSDEQQAIFDAVLRDNVKALAIAALAGTGKTTTLVELAKQLSNVGSSMFCAFNTSIVGELKERLTGTGMDAKTFHSLGYAGLSLTLNAGKLNLDKDKYRNLVRRWMAETTGASDEPSLFRVALDRATNQFFELMGIESHLEKLAIAVLNWVRIKLIAWDDETAIMGLITHYRMTQDIDEMRADFSIGANVALDGLITMLVQSVSRLMTEAERQVRQSRTVDFTDQIYWVVYWNAPIKAYDMVFVDECLPYLTPVQLADGTAMPIGEIVEKRLPVKVLAYDTLTGEQRACEVTAWSKTLNQKPLVKIKVQWTKRHKDVVDGGYKQRPTNFVVCTIDHKIWANGAWVHAGNVQPGMTVQVETSAIKSQAYKISTDGREALAAEMTTKNHAQITRNNQRATITVRGGNGRGMTLAQSVLLEALGDGWIAEYAVKTGMHQGSGYPTNYKVDIANPERMIAVEVDGGSHNNPVQKQRDEKKRSLLESLGWTVVHFSNRECIQSTQQCVQSINDDCPLDAVVVSVEPVSLPDNFVYDITVADCHNFYANGILVHNCQDLSPMQRELVARSVRRTTGRIVLVGDRHQAIYEFSGADSDSFELSVAKFNAVVLPLTLTRRCAKVITQHAAALVPSFRCPTDKPDGKVIWIEEAEFVERAKPGDMVLCRMRAPLVGNCLRLLALGIPATIVGADIGKALLGLLNKIEKRGDYRSFDDVLTVIGTYRDEQVSRALSRDDEDLAARITDECQAITELIKLTNPPNMITLRVKLETLFSEGNADNKVMFSTVHKAKGLERERVFIIAPDRLPLIFGQRKDGKPSRQRPESIAQEYNLDYVARTRAIDTLVYVTNPQFLQKTPQPPYVQLGWNAPTNPAPVEWDDDEDPTEATVDRETGIDLRVTDEAAATGNIPTLPQNSPTGELCSTSQVVTTSPVTDKNKLLTQLCDTLTLDELDLLLAVIQQARSEKASGINGTAVR